MVTERVDKDTAFMPYHFAGHWQGVDLLAHYPQGAAPIIRGEAVQHRHDLRLRRRDDDAGNQDHRLPDRKGGLTWHA